MKTFIFIIILFSISVSYAQTAHGNAPINKGNMWVYQDLEGIGNKVAYEIMDSIEVIDSIEYHLYHNKNGYRTWPIRLREDGFFVEKRDTSCIAPFNEMIIYKKGALPGDSWELNPWGPEHTFTAHVTDTFTIQIFDTLVVARDIYLDFGLDIYYELWTDEFGLIADADFWGSGLSLIGCIINGKPYGDISAVKIMQKHTNMNVPKDIELLPNFPNPFNSTTNITYKLYNTCYTKLKIFNVFGEEVVMLISEKQQKGSYNYIWNADGLSSGVYLIHMSMGKNTQSQKAILIR